MSWFTSVYFVLIVFVGSFLLLNLALAIIVEKFGQNQEENRKKIDRSIRNYDNERIAERYLGVSNLVGAKLKSCSGVPIAKMLLLNPQKYSSRSK